MIRLAKDANNRFFGRPQAPADPSEVRRTERWLATARVFLAVSALVAIRMDPTQLGNSPAAYGLLGFYMGNSILVLMLLRRRKASTASFRILVHAADIVWPAFISVFGDGPRSPFILFFVFVLTAAAYRWGLWETLSTAAAEVVLLWAESFMLFHVWLRHGGSVPWHIFSGLRMNTTEFEPNRLFMLSVYLLVMGLLLGYLAEQQKHLRAEKAGVTRMLSKVRVDAGLTGTLQQISREVVTMYGAARLVIAAQEIHSQRAFLGELFSNNGEISEFKWLDSRPRDAKVYLNNFPGEVCYAVNDADRWSVIALDGEGNQLPALPTESLVQLKELQPFRSLIAISFVFAGEWRGRVFVFEPRWRGDTQEELRFLLDLLRQVGPAVYNVYLLHRLRRRAGAAERARFARELHDGAVQSLIAVEMQVDVLKRQAETTPAVVTGELGRIQGLLREEVLKLRELMQQMKSIDVDSRRFLSVVTDSVERFERETGISARFVTDIEKLEMPDKVCRELLRIVQEGLVNVRKHSRARHALIRLGSSPSQWSLTMEDDGKGFPFSGRVTQQELEQMGKGPMIIKERVHLIAGTLTVESSPGTGSRLEIKVPKSGEVSDEF
ncbi:MAG TPA: histidine kinase [Candidatus Sulfotelmatobacter sp.]|nr:histidine kinase [Candidatus Sulfotelmatobacter sp.]